MTKLEFIEKLAADTGKTKKESAFWLDALCNGIADTVKEHGELKLPGFMIFKRELRPARKCRNPLTGDMIDVPEKYGFKVKVAKKLNELMR